MLEFKIVTGTGDEFQLIYSIVQNTVGQFFKDELKKFTIEDACYINYYTGIPNERVIEEKIIQLQVCAQKINAEIPNRIPDIDLTVDNYQQQLNLLHTHFPELHNTDHERKLLKTLQRYNDLIHWLEHSFRALANGRNTSSFRISLDFNKSEKIVKRAFTESDYSIFDVCPKFGSLILGYPHVGRHAQELFNANDLKCPPDQFVPQTKYGPSCWFYFRELNDSLRHYTQHAINDKFSMFYAARGGLSFFKKERNDPTLAFGCPVIGTLEKILKNSIQYDIPLTVEEQINFKQQLIDSQIVNWQIQ